MKLFVWEGDGVLTDYTDGMIVAIAPDLQSALEVIRATQGYAIGSFPADKAQVIDLGSSPEPRAWICWGGS